VNTCILDVALSLCSELLAQVRGVLILDVLDDGVPTAVIVDKITIAGGIDNVESKSDTVLFNVVRNGLDLGGLADRLVGLEATLRVDQVRSEDGVDERRLAHTRLAYNAQDELAHRRDRRHRQPDHHHTTVDGPEAQLIWEMCMFGTYQRR
jgi:hypothetical protein